MTPEQIDQVGPRLVAFAAEMLAGLPRSDQRAKGQLYVRGLLTDGRRKSMQPMAARLGVDHQGLQQFITSSTWDFERVRARLARWAVGVIGPRVYVVDDTGFAKDGSASPCVARQYSGTLGRVANCQVAASVQMVTDEASLAANWRLFCPESWDDRRAAEPGEAERIRYRRARAGIPDRVRYREKWRLALDMVDQMTIDWGLPRRPVVADAFYGDVTEFRRGLEDRGLTYMVAVKSPTSAHPAHLRPQRLPHTGGPGRPSLPRYRGKPSSVRELALAAGPAACTELTWRHGSRRSTRTLTTALTSRFAAIPVRPANTSIPRGQDGSLPIATLLVEWPDGADEPSDYWLTNLDPATPLHQLVAHAKIRWRVEHDYRELKTGLGLDHFEGRTWTGWNRHVTLACLAQAFATMLRLDPKAPAPA